MCHAVLSDGGSREVEEEEEGCSIALSNLHGLPCGDVFLIPWLVQGPAAPGRGTRGHQGARADRCCFFSPFLDYFGLKPKQRVLVLGEVASKGCLGIAGFVLSPLSQGCPGWMGQHLGTQLCPVGQYQDTLCPMLLLGISHHVTPWGWWPPLGTGPPLSPCPAGVRHCWCLARAPPAEPGTGINVKSRQSNEPKIQQQNKLLIGQAGSARRKPVTGHLWGLCKALNLWGAGTPSQSRGLG